MIITRTPFRVSFFGGGTDYPVWYRENGGAVISTTIDKFCYISCRYLPPFFDHKYRIRYTSREETHSLSGIKHPSVRECIRSLNLQEGIEMVHTSDIPAQSGMGSSSAFTVGFLNALYALKGKMVSKRHLAEDAINIEQNILKENIGTQDQVAAAFGGLNKIEFGGESDFYVYPITVSKKKIEILQEHLMLFFTGFTRNASDIAGEQIKMTPEKKDTLKRMREMVDEAISIINGSSSNITDFGRLLHETWLLKRSLTGKITTRDIDNIYETAMEAGALGGKLLGAGGGGCILFFVEPQLHAAVQETLKNLTYIPFKFENLGSQIVYYAPQNYF